MFCLNDSAFLSFEELVTLTLDQVILHTVVHHSSTSTYMPNLVEIEITFCGRTDIRTYVHTYVWTDGQTFETGFIKSTLSKSRPKELKPGLVTSYDLWSGNGEGLFWFRRFINLPLTYFLRHLPAYLKPQDPTRGKIT